MEEKKFEEQSISINDLLFLLKKNILLIFIMTFITAAIGFFYGFFTKTTIYSSSTTALVEVEVLEGGSEATAFSYSLSLTNTFKEFIVTQPVLSGAVDLLKNDYPGVTKGELKGSVGVTVSTTSLIIIVTAATEDREKSIAFANAILESAIARANQIDGASGEPSTKILANKLKVIEQAYDSVGARGGSSYVVLGAIIGLFISIAIIFVLYFSDNTFTSKSSFEQAFDINILACLGESESDGA